MSKYLRMWQKIKQSSSETRLAFLNEHPTAEGKDVIFMGESFFDVDLLEALRNFCE